MLRAGFATIDITPPVGIELIAYSRPAPSQGVLDRLEASALLLETAETLAVLVSVDHLGLLPADANRVRSLIATDLGVGMHQVMLLFSHTHSGPAADTLSPSASAYLETLTESLRGVARAAHAALRPARVSWGLTTGQIGVNRRQKVDGRAVMGTDPSGPVDPRMGVLKVEDSESGRLMGLLVTCTAHANVLKADNLLLSADFPGAVRRHLQSALGCPVLVRIGAAGNVNALYRGDVSDLDLMARAVCGPVLSLLPDMAQASEAPVWIGSSELSLPLCNLPDLSDAELLADEVTRQWGVDTSDWFAKVRTLVYEGQRSLGLPIEVQLVRIGEGVLTGIPMEPFAETATAISERLGSSLIFFGGYTNGWTGYLPTAGEFAYGGYEVLWNPVYAGHHGGLLTPAQPHAADLIAGVVAKLHQEAF